MYHGDGGMCVLAMERVCEGDGRRFLGFVRGVAL